MAKIELEIGGKYTAQQAFDTLDRQLKSAGQNTGRIFRQATAGFGNVLSQIDGLAPGIQKATSALEGFAAGGTKGGVMMLAVLTIQKCIEKFAELKNAQMDIARQQADIVSHASEELLRKADQAILAGRSALMDASLASKSAAQDLKFALDESGAAYREKIQTALQIKTDSEANAVGEAAKAVCDAQYRLSQAYAAQELAVGTRAAKEKAAMTKFEEAQARLNLAYKELDRQKKVEVAAQQKVVALQEELARVHEARRDLELEGLADTLEYFSIGAQIAGIEEQLKLAQEAELKARQTSSESMLQATNQVKEAELALATATREREALTSTIASEQETANLNVLAATAQLAESRTKQAEEAAKMAETATREREEQANRRMIQSNLLSLENVRQTLLQEANALGYDANSLLEAHLAHLRDGNFTAEQLNAARAGALQEIQVNAEAYRIATQLLDTCGREQDELKSAIEEYRSALASGAATIQDVEKSMGSLKELARQMKEEQELGRIADRFLGGVKLDFTLPNPVDTRDQQAIRKADDMINFGRMGRDQQREARNILTSIKNQGPTLRRFLRNELPPEQKKKMAEYLTRQYADLEEKLGPAKAKEEMTKMLTDVGRRDLLSSADQKKEVQNSLKLFQGLKNNASNLEQRERRKVDLLQRISDNLKPKAK